MAFKAKSLEQLSLGMVLAAVVTTSILWLSYTNKLNLYISSRYDIFSAIMSGCCAILISASTLAQRHFHIKSWSVKLPTLFVVSTICALGLCFLLLQPKVLTSATALQRGINAGGLDLTTTNVVGFGATDYTQFDIREWASVLSQTSSLSFYSGKAANLLGFVAPSPGNDSNIFFVSRFYITCCAIDAQPYGVPIYVTNYKEEYPVDSWVNITGSFIAAPDKNQGIAVVLKPVKIASVPEPQDPYVR